MYLPHVSGLRALLSLWILTGHMVADHSAGHSTSNYSAPQEGFLTILIGRGHVPVQCFLILSGFITHYVNHKTEFVTSSRRVQWPRVVKFLTRRFSSIIGSYYVCYFLILVGILAFEPDAIASSANKLSVGLSLVFLQSWIPSSSFLPNGSAWTLSTLAFSWVCFPFLQMFFKRSNAYASFLFASILTLLPVCIFVAFLSDRQNPLSDPASYLFLYHFPPFRLADFALGMAAAEMLLHLRWIGNRHGLKCAAAGDLILVCGVIATSSFHMQLFVEWDRLERFEVFWISATGPFFALFLILSSLSGGLFKRLFCHPILSSVGELSFQVYISHNVVKAGMVELHIASIELYRAQGHVINIAAPFTPGLVIGGIVCMYILAGTLKAVVDDPISRQISRVMKRKFPSELVVPIETQLVS